MKRTQLKRSSKPLKRTPLKRSSSLIPKQGKSAGKGRSKPISKLKKELWSLFSKYIRQRDNFTCVTCGKISGGTGMHAGHYIPKSVGGMALYFHPKNTHAQCFRCNLHLSGNWPAYQDFILRTYGPEVNEELLRLKNTIIKWTEGDYLREIKKYKELI